MHTSYGWSVPGASIDLEGELAIAMAPLTPAEVGRALGICAGMLYRNRLLFLRGIHASKMLTTAREMIAQQAASF